MSSLHYQCQQLLCQILTPWAWYNDHFYETMCLLRESPRLRTSDAHSDDSLQSIVGHCNITIYPPREWRIAIPASLMRVDYYYIMLIVILIIIIILIIMINSETL